jgi:uncharacterized protein YerC
MRKGKEENSAKDSVVLHDGIETVNQPELQQGVVEPQQNSNAPNVEVCTKLKKDDLAVELSDLEIKGHFESTSIRRILAMEPIPFRLPVAIGIYNARPPNPYFVPRQQLIDELTNVFGYMGKTGESFQELRSVILSAFHGLSGVGKTQLALYYFNESKKTYKFKAWFQADSEETLQREYLLLAYEAGLIEPDSKTEEKPEVIVRRVKDWLARNPGWLLIYDNAQNYEAIEEFLPAKGGDILITSKSDTWIGQHIFVSVMELDEAIALVKKICELADDSENADIIALVEKLGRLPLAIAQAAAYIKAQKQTVATYLELYETKRSKMLSDDTLRNFWSKKEHEPVAVTWLLSIEELRKTVPDAEQLLQFCAYLASRDIPNYILQACLCQTKETKHEEEAEQQVAKRYPQRAFWKLLTAIKQYSLLEINKQKETVTVHQLVQTVIQEKLDQEIQKDIILKSINVSTSESREKTPTMKDIRRRINLISHMWSLKKHGEALFFQFDETKKLKIQLPLSLDLADVYKDLGYAISGKELLEDALAIQEKYYGKDHWNIAPTLGNLANVYCNLGDWKNQKRLLERTLTIQEMHYGKDHGFIGTTLTNLAIVYSNLGDIDNEKKLLESSLKIKEAYYGKEHWRVAITLNHLGNMYGMLGNVEIQKQLLERALSIRETYYGKDHLEVASAMTNLANVYYHGLGNTKKGKQLLEYALEIFETHYGKNHWKLVEILNNLANVYRGLGDLKTQKQFLECVFTIEETHYGKDHWKTASTLANLASVYGYLGDPQTEKQLSEQALARQEQHYGKDHWQTVPTLIILSDAYSDFGDANTQKQLLERALVISEAHYGKKHWELAAILVNLANAKGALGEIKDQKKILEDALEVLEMHYGKDHWETTAVLNNLASVYGDLGDEHTQKQLLERALLIEKAHYGEDHWQTAPILANLANVYGCLGNAKAQKQLLERVLIIQETHYGKGHWKIATTLSNLANAYGDLGEAKTKEKLLRKVLEIFELHYGKKHWKVGAVLNDLATAYSDLGDIKTEKKLLESALEIFELHYGTEHWKVASVLNGLATVYGELGDKKKEMRLLQKALEIKEIHYGKSHWQMAGVLNNLAVAYGALGDSKMEKKLLERVLTIFEAHYGRNHWQVAQVLSNLACVYGDLGDIETKKQFSERALEIFEAYYGKEHWKVAQVMIVLANAYGDLGNQMKQIAFLQRALEINKQFYGDFHGKVGMVLHNLAEAYFTAQDYPLAFQYTQQATEILLQAPGFGESHSWTQLAIKLTKKIKKINSQDVSKSIRYNDIARQDKAEGNTVNYSHLSDSFLFEKKERPSTNEKVDKTHLTRKGWADFVQREKVYPKLDKIADIMEQQGVKILLPDKKYHSKLSTKGWQLFSTNNPNYLMAILLIENKEQSRKLAHFFSQKLKIFCRSQISSKKPCISIVIKAEEITNAVIDKLIQDISKYLLEKDIFLSEQVNKIHEGVDQDSSEQMFKYEKFIYKQEEKKMIVSDDDKIENNFFQITMTTLLVDNILLALTKRLSMMDISVDEYQADRNLYGTEPYSIDYKLGDCLFASIAAFEPNETVLNLRQRMIRHVEQDAQLKNKIITLAHSETPETLRTQEGEKIYKSFLHYITLMAKEQTWGTAIEVVALARLLQRPIVILTPCNQYDYIVEEEAYQNNEPIFLNYVGEIHYEPLSVPVSKDAKEILQEIRQAITVKSNKVEEQTKSEKSVSINM